MGHHWLYRLLVVRLQKSDYDKKDDYKNNKESFKKTKISTIEKLNIELDETEIGRKFLETFGHIQSAEFEYDYPIRLLEFGTSRGYNFKKDQFQNGKKNWVNFYAKGFKGEHF